MQLLHTKILKFSAPLRDFKGQAPKIYDEKFDTNNIMTDMETQIAVCTSFSYWQSIVFYTHSIQIR